MRTQYTSTQGVLEALVCGSRLSRRKVSTAIGRNENFLTNYASNKTVPNISLVNDVAHACGYEMLFRGNDEEIVVTPPNIDDSMIG